MLTKSELKEWTDWMLANPDKRAVMVLQDSRGYCCLGVLAMLHNVPATESDNGCYEFQFAPYASSKTSLRRDLAARLGSALGIFKDMEMPDLCHGGTSYSDLASANDSGVPWEVIAKHLLDHYPAINDPDQEEN